MRDNHEIIALIKKEADSRDISMSELSRRVGMAKSAISRYFNETREFPLNRADDFAKALGISTEYLLGFEEEEDPQTKHLKAIAAHIRDDATEEEIKEIQRFIDYTFHNREDNE